MKKNAHLQRTSSWTILNLLLLLLSIATNLPPPLPPSPLPPTSSTMGSGTWRDRRTPSTKSSCSALNKTSSPQLPFRVSQQLNLQDGYSEDWATASTATTTLTTTPTTSKCFWQINLFSYPRTGRYHLQTNTLEAVKNEVSSYRKISTKKMGKSRYQWECSTIKCYNRRNLSLSLTDKSHRGSQRQSISSSISYLSLLTSSS